jgi:hypothetical protein
LKLLLLSGKVGDVKDGNEGVADIPLGDLEITERPCWPCGM